MIILFHVSWYFLCLCLVLVLPPGASEQIKLKLKILNNLILQISSILERPYFSLLSRSQGKTFGKGSISFDVRIFINPGVQITFTEIWPLPFRDQPEQVYFNAVLRTFGSGTWPVSFCGLIYKSFLYVKIS